MSSGFEDNYNFDKVTYIIIDLGLKLTKVGFGNEPEPRKIIFTPNFFDYEKFMKEDTKYQMNRFMKMNASDKEIINIMSSPNTNILLAEKFIPLTKLPNLKSLLCYSVDNKKIKFEIESFVYNIFYNILQLKKQQRDKNYVCLLCVDFALKNILLDKYQILIKTILENQLIHSIRLLPKNILPIFTTGLTSGIVLEIGYLNTTITPINNGTPYLDKIQTITMGSFDLEKILKRKIIEENILISVQKRKINDTESFSNNIIKYLDDLVVKSTICVNKKLSMSIKEDENKLKGDQDFSKIDYCKDVQDFQISFLTRVVLGETFFGDANNEEINIAYSLLKVILDLKNEDRRKLSQNIVLSGGSSMLMGFYKKLIDEIIYLLNYTEFEELKNLKENIKIHKIIFPRNCLTWIGASILSNYERYNIKNYSITKEDLENKSIEKILSYYN
jgi:actin-related protein 10